MRNKANLAAARKNNGEILCYCLREGRREREGEGEASLFPLLSRQICSLSLTDD